MSMEDNVLTWTSEQVASWLGTIGFNSYIQKFQDEGITGEVLVYLDHETLLDLNLKSLGKRIQLLKAIYELKVRFNIPIFSEDYAPPGKPFSFDTSLLLEIYLDTIEDVCYEDEMFGGYQISDNKVVAALKERDAVIKLIVQEISKLNLELVRLREPSSR
ncbi:hypothetical protein K502DRAFT_347254 [Neoconidiobolus thromboides FSU 785]|nr:hypothetical protein K502DRAFT_347254 [Neoconidiobolus thromboides FSU 785]